MNWDAVGAIAELTGAIVVIVTLGYLAIQVRHTKTALSDQNRLERSRAVREMALAVVNNPELASAQMKNWGLESYYIELGNKQGMSPEHAITVDWANSYYYWMYWGQYRSTTNDDDLEELRHVLTAFASVPGMKSTWNDSPMVRPLLDPDFVKFVDVVMDAAGRN